MATQGIVSIIEKGHPQNKPRVLMKIVAGCDGYNATELSTRLEELWPVSPERAYELAQQFCFGSEACLVVVTPDEIIFRGDEDLDPGYQETLQDPNWNPRWKHGTADHVVIIAC